MGRRALVLRLADADSTNILDFCLGMVFKIC